jgi:hypothetical protein
MLKLGTCDGDVSKAFKSRSAADRNRFPRRTARSRGTLHHFQLGVAAGKIAMVLKSPVNRALDSRPPGNICKRLLVGHRIYMSQRIPMSVRLD